MSNSKDKKEWQSALEAREYALGNRKNRPNDVYKHAGVIKDDQIREFLSMCKMFYNPDKADLDIAQFEDTRLYNMLVQRFGTETLTKALQGDNPQVQSFFVGNPGSKSDISGMRAIESLKEIIKGEAPILYIWGPPGSGKTNFALLLAQMWKRYFHENGEIGTNIASLEQKDKWIDKWYELDSWITDNVTDIEDGGKTTKKDAKSKLYIFDEASTHAPSTGKEGWETRQKLAPMVFKIRKAKAGLIIIGHDGKDVDPSIRTLAKCVQKFRDSKKEARIFEDVNERQGINEFSFSPIKGIPETDWNYDDKEATSFSWEESQEQEEKFSKEEAIDMANELTKERAREYAIKLYNHPEIDVTQKQLANNIEEVSQSYISNNS